MMSHSQDTMPYDEIVVLHGYHRAGSLMDHTMIKRASTQLRATLSLILASTSSSTAAPLVEDGNSDYQIVIPAKTSPSITHAARELQDFISAKATLHE